MLIFKKTAAVVIIIILICGAVMVAYKPSIQGPFVLDDIGNIVENPHVYIEKLDLRSLALAAKPPQSLGGQRRPLAY